MKRKVLFIFLVSILISCHKEDDINYPSFITAGQTQGDGIKYVDFEPDKKFVSYSNELKRHIILDLNNDGIDDFELVYDFPWSWGLSFLRFAYVIPLGNNSVCISEKGERLLIEALELGDTIDANNNWLNSQAYLYAYSYQSGFMAPDATIYVNENYEGDWYNRDNIFVGVKIINEDYELYGWIDVAILKDENTGILRQYSVTEPF